jgi:hypothetical protein
MNDLLFTALILATLYYFFYYLPEKKKLEPKLSQSISTQTDPLSDEKEKLLESTIDELIKQIKQLNQTIR